jgi:hypothetical protein
MLPNSFKPKKLYNLIRLGSDNDGGYLVEIGSHKKTKTLFSFGLGNDWHFERMFIRKSEEKKAICFDYKINKFFYLKNLIKSLEKFILFKSNLSKFYFDCLSNIYLFFFLFDKKLSYYERAIAVNKKTDTISSLFNEFKPDFPVFLKIDIEGCEYRLLDEIINYQDSLSGIVIEFHNADIHIDYIKNFISKTKLTLVHFHANNADYLDKNNNPITFEMTFANSPNEIKGNVLIPHYLDQKSTSKNPEHEVFFEH